MSELPSIWMRTTTANLPLLRTFDHVRITVHLNEDYDINQLSNPTIEKGQNYRPFEWGLRLFRDISPVHSFWVRITVHLNEDYDIHPLLKEQTTSVRITVHLNEDYDLTFTHLKCSIAWSELPSIWMRTTTKTSPGIDDTHNRQNYRPFEWGLRPLFCFFLSYFNSQNYRPFEWGLRLPLSDS